MQQRWCSNVQFMLHITDVLLPRKRALEPHGADLMQRSKIALAVMPFGVYIAAERKADVVGDRVADRIGTERTTVVYIDDAACRKLQCIA